MAAAPEPPVPEPPAPEPPAPEPPRRIDHTVLGVPRLVIPAIDARGYSAVGTRFIVPTDARYPYLDRVADAEHWFFDIASDIADHIEAVRPGRTVHAMLSRLITEAVHEMAFWSGLRSSLIRGARSPELGELVMLLRFNDEVIKDMWGRGVHQFYEAAAGDRERVAVPVYRFDRTGLHDIGLFYKALGANVEDEYVQCPICDDAIVDGYTEAHGEYRFVAATLWL